MRPHRCFSAFTRRPRFRALNPCLSGYLLLIGLLMGEPGLVQATSLYWDTNGTVAGAGSAATGAWNGSTALWNTDPTGGATGALQAAATINDALFFVAGPGVGSGDGTSTITATSGRAAASLNFQQSGDLNITGGSISLAGGLTGADLAYDAVARGGVTIGSNITLTASQTFTNNNTANAITLSGAITGAFSLIKEGAGTIALTGANNIGVGGITVNGGTLLLTKANTYSGGTTLNAGNLQIGLAGALGSGALIINGGTISNSATVTLATNPQTWNSSFAATLGAGFNLNMGTGAVTMANNIAIDAGTAGTIFTVGGVINDGASTFNFTKDGAGTVALTGANLFSGSVTINNGVLNLTKANAYAGGTTLNSGGTLQIGLTGAIGSGALTINGGTLGTSASTTLATNNLQTWNGNFAVTPNAAQNLNMGTGAVTMTTNIAINETLAATTFTVGGVIDDGADSFSLTKDGAGNVALTGANSYGGGTILNNGILQLGNATAIGTGALTINGGSLGSTASTTLSTNNGQTWNANFGATLAAGSTLNLGTGAVTMTNNIAINATASGTNLVIGGVIDDGVNSYNFTKDGAGSLTLSGKNTYGGGTTLNAGSLALGNADALGTGGLVINGGGISTTVANLVLTDHAETWNGNFNVSVSGSFNIGLGNVTLGNNVTITTNAGTYSQPFIVGGVIADGVNDYRLTIVGGGANPSSVQLGGTNTFSGGVTLGSGGILKLSNGAGIGTGTLILNGGSIGTTTYMLPITLTNNNAQIWDGNWSLLSGTGAMDFGTGAVSLTGSRSIGISNTALTVGGVISDSVAASGFGITINYGQYGAGVTFKGANTFDGGLTLTTASNSNTETFYIGNLGVNSTASAIGTGLLTLSPGGGTLSIDNSSAAAGTLATNNAQAWNGDFTFVGSKNLNMGTGAVTLGANVVLTVSAGVFGVNGAIGDGGNNRSLTKIGAGALEVGGSGSNYTGGTTVNVGILRLINGDDRLSTASVLTVGGGATAAAAGTFDMNGRNQKVAGLSGGSGTVKGKVTNNATSSTSTLEITGSGIYEGVIVNGTTGVVALTKSTGGVQELTGVHTYTGITSVTGGTLSITGSGSINNTSAVNVTGGTFAYNSSAALTAGLNVSSAGTLAGTGTVGVVILGTGGTLSPGNSPGGQTMSSLTLNNGANYNWQILDATGAAGTGYDTINLTGTLNLANLTGIQDFNINLWSLSGTGPDANGAPLNLGASHTWTLISSNNAIAGFDATEFTINTGAVNGTGGFAGTGNFTVGLGDGGTDLVLNYTAVPEPSAALLLILGVAVLIFRRPRLL